MLFVSNKVGRHYEITNTDNDKIEVVSEFALKEMCNYNIKIRGVDIIDDVLHVDVMNFKSNVAKYELLYNFNIDVLNGRLRHISFEGADINSHIKVRLSDICAYVNYGAFSVFDCKLSESDDSMIEFIFDDKIELASGALSCFRYVRNYIPDFGEPYDSQIRFNMSEVTREDLAREVYNEFIDCNSTVSYYKCKPILKSKVIIDSNKDRFFKNAINDLINGDFTIYGVEEAVYLRKIVKEYFSDDNIRYVREKYRYDVLDFFNCNIKIKDKINVISLKSGSLVNLDNEPDWVGMKILENRLSKNVKCSYSFAYAYMILFADETDVKLFNAEQLFMKNFLERYRLEIRRDRFKI